MYFCLSSIVQSDFAQYKNLRVEYSDYRISNTICMKCAGIYENRENSNIKNQKLQWQPTQSSLSKLELHFCGGCLVVTENSIKGVFQALLSRLDVRLFYESHIYKVNEIHGRKRLNIWVAAKTTRSLFTHLQRRHVQSPIPS